ncbi:monovalent cation/H(+) antiporter subunit G [Chloroflexota bacterium]
MTDILAIIFISAGVFFMTVGVVGLLRLPDFYTRNHAVGATETLGIMLFILGLCIFQGFNLGTAKLVIILVFVSIANPTATHAILNAALTSGLEPWTKLSPSVAEEPGFPAIDPTDYEGAAK